MSTCRIPGYDVEELDAEELVFSSDPDYPPDEEEQWWEDQDIKDWWEQFEKDK